MSSIPIQNSKLTNRRGAAAIEFAVILPFILLMLMGSIEFGRAVMIQHMLEEAARAGCRVGVFENGSKQDVVDIIDAAMLAGKVQNYTIEMSPDPPENLNAFEPVTVSVSLPYSEVSWIRSSFFMQNSIFTGVCVMPAEGDGANDPDSKDTPTGKKNKKQKRKKKKPKKVT